MLQTYTTNETGVTVATDANLTFENNALQTGCTARHTAGSTTITLNRAGIYMISFNADVAAASTAGDITVVMNRNGTAIPYARAMASSTAVTDFVNLAFTTLIQERPSCNCMDNRVSITFVNDGVEAVYRNMNVVVTKVA